MMANEIPFSQYGVERIETLEKEIETMRLLLSRALLEKNAIEKALGLKATRKPRSGTISEAALTFLNKNGASEVSSIVQSVNATLGTDFKRERISPQLSRLKSIGKLSLNGKEWSAT